MNHVPSPIQFHPLLKTRVWGGRTLERLGKVLPPGQMVGESWELADLPESIGDGRSVIASPDELAGRTLHDVLRDPLIKPQIMGEAKLSPEGGFPLLIKFLDARQNLSVQVHPSAGYARQHPESHLKSEAWVVVDAEPGAVIYKGLKPGVSRESFAEHVRSGAIVHDLVQVAVKPGDCHYLPSGTCHALGAGIVVAEVQTPSDTTFRVYDWGRPQGAGRQLHIEQAMQCIDFSAAPRSARPPIPPTPDTRHGITTATLARTEYFEIERVDGRAGSSFEIVTQGLPQIWMVIAGDGRIEGDFRPAGELRPGLTILVPAAARGWQVRLTADSWLLCVRLPSPLRSMIANDG